MSHFSLKSLSLYGIAITTTVVLFNILSAYGEKNLKAPPPVNGFYRLETNNLPECFQSDALGLIIEQSGIYLRGQLLPQSAQTSAKNSGEETSFLSGKWNNQQVNLSGSLAKFQECQQQKITLQALWQNNSLMGQLNLDSLNEVVNFMGKKEEVEKKSTQEH